MVLSGNFLATARRWGVVALYSVLLVALAIAYQAWTPAAHIDRPALVLALAALAVLAVYFEAVLPARITLGSLPGVSLIAIYMAGPRPALVIVLIALMAPAALGRERLLRMGNLANVVSHAAMVLAACLVLEALGTGLDGLAAAYLAQLVVNWTLGPGLFIPLWLGWPLSQAIAYGVWSIPSVLIVAVFACATILLAPLNGGAALALFALAVIAPQATLVNLPRRTTARRLARGELSCRYASALALELDLDNAACKRVDAVAAIVAERRPTGVPVDFMVATLTDRSPAACDAGHMTEWVDGSGGPAGLQGGMIPLAARVVAVADAWAGTTAAGTEQLSHPEAMKRLRAEAAIRLDPAVVDAAERLILCLPRTTAPRRLPSWLPLALRRDMHHPGGGSQPA